MRRSRLRFGCAAWPMVPSQSHRTKPDSGETPPGSAQPLTWTGPASHACDLRCRWQRYPSKDMGKIVGHSAVDRPDTSSVTESLSKPSTEATSFAPQDPHANEKHVMPLWVSVRSQCSLRESPNTARQDGHLGSVKAGQPVLALSPTHRGRSGENTALRFAEVETIDPAGRGNNPRECALRSALPTSIPGSAASSVGPGSGQGSVP